MSGDSPMTDEQIEAALAEGLEHEPWCNRGADVLDDDDIACASNRLLMAGNLLPVVRRVAEQRAAEAVQPLLDLADELLAETTDTARVARAYKDAGKWPGAAAAEAKAWTSGDAAARIRAAALTATPNHGRNAT